MSTSFLSVTPLIPTGGSLAEALEFFVEQLGFTVLWKAERMAAVARDQVSFNLVENTNREWAENASFSIGVADLQALYEEYRGVSADLGALEEKAWGRREFHMILPSGVALQFYHRPSV